MDFLLLGVCALSNVLLEYTFFFLFTTVAGVLLCFDLGALEDLALLEAGGLPLAVDKVVSIDW